MFDDRRFPAATGALIRHEAVSCAQARRMPKSPEKWAFSGTFLKRIIRGAL